MTYITTIQEMSSLLWEQEANLQAHLKGTTEGSSGAPNGSINAAFVLVPGGSKQITSMKSMNICFGIGITEIEEAFLTKPFQRRTEEH
jgi:hypothetical protein